MKRLANALVKHALRYPDAHEDHPWGETAVKVGKKGFVFTFQPDGTQLNVTVKLPESGHAVLKLPFAEPTGYNMGQHGWVTLTMTKDAKAPIGALKDWVDESYRAVATKKNVKRLDEDGLA